MNEIKLNSEEVPGKFVEWLLAMGCPADIVPSVDKVTEMCRGHYMVWRSMMEHVDAKDVIRKKRLQVFCDDVRRFEKQNKFAKSDTITEPEQLKLWREQRELSHKVSEAKLGVDTVKQDFKLLMDKVEGKMLQQTASTTRLQDTQRRSWLLQQLSQQLQTKADNLKETQTIADSLCCVRNEIDVDSKLDKCLHSLRRQLAGSNGGAPPSANTTVSSVSSANSDGDLEENLSSLLKCHGDVLCSKLTERRASLIKALTDNNETPSPRAKLTPSSIVTHTAGLHCTLSLEASKNKVHLKHSRGKIVDAVSQLSNYLTGESCELLVIRCEKAHIEARVKTLRAIHDELIARSGVFQVSTEEDCAPLRPIGAVNKAIETKRDELKKLISCLAATERKIQNVRECLVAFFRSFHEGSTQDWDKFRGLQLELPVEPISSVRKYYEECLDKKKNKLELTMEMDESENSLSDGAELTNPKYVDELKLYLKKFNLEKNRKLVLESGHQIWIFETVQSSLARIHSHWLSQDVTSQMMTSSNSLTNNLRALIDDLEDKRTMEDLVKVFDLDNKGRDLELTKYTQEEDEIIDLIRKRLTNNILGLEKANKTLDLAQNNLKLWSENPIKKYISADRIVQGLTYREYELYYLDNCVHI